MNGGLVFLQFATGVFFVTTGYRKLFRPEVRAKVIPFMQKQTGLPAPFAWAAVTAEFAGGLALVFGVLGGLASWGLLALMGVAYATTIWPEVREKDRGAEFSKLLSNALCTPEAQLIIILATLATIGGAY